MRPSGLRGEAGCESLGWIPKCTLESHRHRTANFKTILLDLRTILLCISSFLATEPFQTAADRPALPTLVDGLRDMMLLSARDICYNPQVSQTPHHAHAVLQGGFSETAIRSAQVSEFSDTPILSFGATADQLSDKVRCGFIGLARISISYVHELWTPA
jgi:hypothetical protein